MVLLLFMVGERLEGWAASRARQGVSALMALKLIPPLACVTAWKPSPSAISPPRDVIEVAAGGRLPADGQLRTPFASFDEKCLNR